MIIRSLLIASALFAATAPQVLADSLQDRMATPTLRANVTVSGDIVRIGDVIDNAGSAAQIAIYRAPDLGTTGTLPADKVLNALRAHQVIGVDARGLREISVTRLSRNLDSKEIEQQIARAIERKNGLGDAANLSLTFDREIPDLKLDASNSGSLQAVSSRFDPRSTRFDVTFEIANDNGTAPTKLRFTGTAVETVEAAVLVRGVERNEILKSSDVVVERRPKGEVGIDAASRDQAVGMQVRKQVRAGQPLRQADLAKPDLVQRDQAVTLIYESAGLYLTIRGKALENGTDGDVVSVMNLQSKRTITGTVTGRGQVSVTMSPPRQPRDNTSSLDTPEASVNVAANSRSPAPKAE